MRTALLAAVGHHPGTRLASAIVAVAGLRCRDTSLSGEDSVELLATAGESLDRLARLVANLLDMSRCGPMRSWIWSPAARRPLTGTAGESRRTR